MKKIDIFCKIIILLGFGFIFSCGQDPIFFTISTEPIPIKPRIPGGPTGMVVTNNIMYVASGSLHWYAGGSWNSGSNYTPQPGGRVLGLAATTKYLYALCLSGTGNNTVLRRIETTTKTAWEGVSISGGYPLIQTIYADPSTNMLFAGAMSATSGSLGILSISDNDTSLTLLESDTELLSGAVYSSPNYYLCTRGKGVYIANGSPPPPLSATQLTGSQGRLFMGMIKLDDTAKTIIAVERKGGTLFKVESTGLTPVGATDKFATGALTLWQDDATGTKKMLIAGRQEDLTTTATTSFSHGYVEFDYETDGTIGGRREPSVSIHGNTDRYNATIGKHPINHMYQAISAIDSNMTLFASTQSAGLWSYRDRADGGWQWNAEN